MHIPQVALWLDHLQRLRAVEGSLERGVSARQEIVPLTYDEKLVAEVMDVGLSSPYLLETGAHASLVVLVPAVVAG
jgi:hypothetical protein